MTLKPGMQTSTQEECGVWLDTVELKDKAKLKQKNRSTRPISKLLNPFLKGGGYNLAVALNFTQTKLEMPKTKQTFVSNFFEPQRRILKKKSVLGTSNGDRTASAASTPTNNKQRRDPEPSWDCERVKERSHGTKTEASPLQGRDGDSSPTRIERICSEDSENLSPRPRKRRNVENLLHQEETNNGKDGGFDQKKQKSKYVRNDPPAEEDFVFPTPLITSTQKPSSRHSQDDHQEGLAEFSGHTQPSLPKDIPENLRRTTDRDSPSKSSPRKRSPVKKPGARHVEDSLSTLFTQDSEGFRVIAHRVHRIHSPAKRKTWTTTVYTESRVDEDELPFTQDSEGNTVIKHS